MPGVQSKLTDSVQTIHKMYFTDEVIVRRSPIITAAIGVLLIAAFVSFGLSIVSHPYTADAFLVGVILFLAISATSPILKIVAILIE